MIRSWLRAFFVVLIVVGGVWWYWGNRWNQGEISKEATRIEVESSPSPSPVFKEAETKKVTKEHEPVEAGVGDWQWEMVWLGSFGVGLLMWGMYKVTYRVYWWG